MAGIRSTILSLHLPDKLKDEILAVYRIIAEAESRVHGMEVSEIHLHEVGMKDAIADITAVCVLMDLIAPDRVISSPVTTGYGYVRCAHGLLPVPAPATALLLDGIPIQAGSVEAELCTPTGAALISHFADSFSQLPSMQVTHIGYGMGSKEFARLNCVRAFLGTAEGGRRTQGTREDEVLEFSCNLDDMTGEELGFATEELLSAGVLDVWTCPILMKKNRPGILLTVLCKESSRERILSMLFRLTTTLGVRETLHRRHILARESAERETTYGVVRRKRSEGFGVFREKDEYEDLAAIARSQGLNLREVRELLRDK